MAHCAGRISAALLLHYGLQMSPFGCNYETSKSNKTRANRCVRNGQVELANRRLQPPGHLFAAINSCGTAGGSYSIKFGL